MQFTAQQIGTLLEGRIEGNPEVTVGNLAKIEEGKKGDLSFLSNPKYEHFIYTTDASIVIVNEDLQLTQATKPTLTIIRVKNAYAAFSTILNMYNEFRLDKSGREEPHFIHAEAEIGQGGYIGAFVYIGRGASIGDNVKIYPQVYIGDKVTIGDNTTLYPGVKIYHDCKIGKNVVVHSGVVIGSDGFGFAPQEDGTYKKVPQIGYVQVEDNVEIGANTVIDRATMGATIVRDGVKLDNLIQIAHNVDIGKNTVIAAQTGISGSSKIGEHVVLGGQVGVVGHIVVAKGSQIQAQSGVNRSIKEEGKKWGGTPVMPYQPQLRSNVIFARLPELEKRIQELEKLVEKKLK
ncbi:MULTISPECIES: UDP-3-O-(3-hydroxymyristoyl)glucosamine N-acyltransferase [Sphingobacterium]|jgi:UDP-3-O-[3-hydroxymyristoyl] glucosamine N-acyltransferase|uniref:UDP-3-O-acylglucosamine N-acyltransferase n=2 Tax=Sphingobacterium TaxID=28453 RepID=A0A420G6X2_9SPHI|nr:MULTISPECIES: UDP-3-O-(3-hydroxymyristoyl)glucosamine N-acyltransferase [Sphingobacterium]APU95494.1 UDP-3-O-(3-hydroxymyristoyl)glucosamine N-acyltransferase [Sphingobacterium sp. B29]QQT31067.1 UDP-3-O-(3-hydroxymyristoyl)glucosamine N-acyltransferase [Sphingobacterium multivorum]QQT53000.1 UDP-3-O-(3-hydroxymyristoyl)glucosamine N-acyltransferase [Sphingobacterium multivorum]RKF40949.1 UDP-3-O-(3-hydroxymyristoyl)glucosamine N-acyltransferase [Sphingobacterium siyangense]TWI24005.1 UDP-3